MALIELKGVYCGSEEGSFFSNADLELFAGERVVITGKLGTGKRALIELISGIKRPERGRVVVFGEEMGTAGPADVRTRMGFVFGGFPLISNLKVVENVALPLLYHSELSSRECFDRAMELLDYTGYKGEPWQQPGLLTQYNKRLVELARAVSLEPRIIAVEGFMEGLGSTQRSHLVRLLLEYHGAADTRLLVMIMGEDEDLGLLSPDRVVRIVGERFVAS